MKRSPTRSKIFLFAILSLFIGGLMLIVAGCPGEIDPVLLITPSFAPLLKNMLPLRFKPDSKIVTII